MRTFFFFSLLFNENTKGGKKEGERKERIKQRNGAAKQTNKRNIKKKKETEERQKRPSRGSTVKQPSKPREKKMKKKKEREKGEKKKGREYVRTQS